MSHLPVLLVIVYLGSAFLTPLLSRLKRFSANWFAVGVAALGLLVSGTSALYLAEVGPFSYFPGGHPLPWGIEISVDWVAVYMQLTINFIAFMVLIYSKADLIREVEQGAISWYYTLFFLLMAALNGLALAADLFNIYVFTEISSLTACALVAIKSQRQCVEASLKYMILSTLGSGMVLLGISLIYMVTGHPNINVLGQALPAAFAAYPWNILVALSLFIIGFGIKSALFPLHVWLPDAHSSAPTPSSAVLSGLVIKVYVIVLAKIIFQVFGIDLFSAIPIPEVLLLLATFGTFAGSILAIGQKDIKRMLAYSSVAQICYIYMGLALVTETGAVGGLLHVFNHAVMKSSLFLAAGAIIYKTGIRKIEDLAGIGYRMPITMAVFSVGALSMVGIPGFSGFISKYYLAFGALDAGKPFYVAVILLSSLLNAIYYFPIIVRAFFGQGGGKFSRDNLPRMMSLPMLVLAGITVYFGILPGGLVKIVELAAATWLR